VADDREPPADAGVHIDFCGEIFPVLIGETVTLGREGQIQIDDNPYLHRQFLQVTREDWFVWLGNVGSTITATVADADGLAQTWLSPGGRIPLVFPTTVVWFTAGPTTYELEIVLSDLDSTFVPVKDDGERTGDTTIGRVNFTPDQLLLVLALAEMILRRGNRGGGAIPASAVAAEQLGWTITKFNRKLDNVCEKLTKLGIRGLVGDSGHAASNRRIRLVEYALASRLVTPDDLPALDAARAFQRDALGSPYE
jgi:hypothetical protein